MRNRDEKPVRISKAGLSDKRLQYVLSGILLILYGLIITFDRTGFLGKILAYPFLYLFGSTYLFVVLIALIFGVYLIVEKDKIRWKWSVSGVFSVLLLVFVLIAFGDNEALLSAVVGEYTANFKAIVNVSGWKELFSSHTGGGFIGRLLYSLLAYLITPVATRILYVVATIISLFFTVKPFAYAFGERVVRRKEASKARDERKAAEKEREFSRYFDEREKIFLDRKTDDEFINRSEVKVRSFDEASFVDEKESPRGEKRRLERREVGSRSAIDVFKNQTWEKDQQPEPISEPREEYPTSSVGKSFNIFREKPISDDATRVSKRENIPDPSINADPLHRYRESDRNTQGGVFVPYRERRANFRSRALEIKENTSDFTEEKPAEKPVVNEVNADNFLREEINNDAPISFTPDEGLFAQTSEVKTEEIKEETKENDVSAIETPSVEMKIKTKPYRLPGIDLLTKKEPHTDEENAQEARLNMVRLNNKLESMGIRAEATKYTITPTFTQFEIVPEKDVRLSVFSAIRNDLMMALSAESLNILAPVPGTNVVGVEVPNKQRDIVSFREVFETIVDSDRQKKPLLVAFGKDVRGEAVCRELDDAPHLLIAGATGSGKSVCVNTILISLLMRLTPDEARLIIVDPKRVELSKYAGIAHLMCPPITEWRHAVVALDKLTKIMDARYHVLSDCHVTKIAEYNKYAAEHNLEKMPYIIVVIDELADLMMNSKHEVENSIARLTQLARAVGIVLIVATQRPSVDVITGMIKANIPSRIAFATASSVDSMTILGVGDANNLLGTGDMLLHMQGDLNNVRAQGAFVSDEEITRVVDFIRRQREPRYDEDFLDLEPPRTVEQQTLDSALGSKKTTDDDVKTIIRYLQTVDEISTSAIQRKFSFGFQRAGRIIDKLTEMKLISPQDGSRPRKVYRDEIVAKCEEMDADENGNDRD